MHLCIADSIRAMPEKEKPPAMPVDIYLCWHKPLRSVGLSAIYLVTAHKHMQLSLFDDTAEQLLIQEQIEKTMDMLQYRFGHDAIMRASALLNPKLTGFNPKEDHTIHPYSYFRWTCAGPLY